MSRSFGWRAAPDRDPLPEGEVSLQLASRIGRFVGPHDADGDHAGALDGEVLEGPLIRAFLAGVIASAGMDDEDVADAERVLKAITDHGRVEIEVRR